MEQQASPAIMAGSRSTRTGPAPGIRRRYVLHGVARENVDTLWALAHPHTRNEQDAYELCRNGSYQLFLIYDTEENEIVGSLLVQMVLDDGLVANVFGLGGKDLRKWLFLISDLEESVRLYGARAIEIIEDEKGAVQWQRLLPDYFVTSVEDGWTTFEKRL